MSKILWVQDENNGPMNGLAEYNGEKVWFSRVDPSKSLVSPNYNETDGKKQETSREYALTRLSDDILKMVVENHIAHCEASGGPTNHGDPIRVRRRPRMNDQKQTETDAKSPQSLNKVVTYKHTINPSTIYGEHITNIQESQFTNYLVPRRVIML